MTTPADRYADKPMLRLLDAYVLDAIGALDEQTQAMNAANADRIAAALKVSADTWQGAVEAAMGMPPDSVDAVRAIWRQYVEDALADGGTPDPLEFTHRLNDTRFADDAPSA